MYNTYIPLLTYAHANGAAGSKVIPGLAEGLPKITNGGKTYTLILRKGLKYSDGTPVKASDFASAVERLFKLNSGGSSFYTDIVGAEKFAETKTGGISGIKTDDKTGKIVIDLTKPRGTFTNELALPFVAPVPAGHAGQEPHRRPAAGHRPLRDHQVRTRAAAGPTPATRSGRRPTQADARTARAATSTRSRSRSSATTRPRSTKSNGARPTGCRPAARRPLRQSQGKYEGTQFRVEPTISTYFFWMNTTKPPFDDLKVRQAVNYAVDPEALERIYAGQLAADPADPAAGDARLQDVRALPAQHGQGEAADREANPSDRNITVWTDNESPNNEAGAYYQGVLERTRLQRQAEDNQRRQLLHGDRQRIDARPRHRLGRLVRGLPAPERLLPAAAGRRKHPADQQHELLADRRPEAEREDRQARRSNSSGPSRKPNTRHSTRNTWNRRRGCPTGTGRSRPSSPATIDLDKVIFNPTFGHDLTSFQFK